VTSLRRRRRSDERGAATAELVIATPVLLLLVLLIVQFGLWYHASSVATAAAQEGARAARLEGATGDDGYERAVAFLDATGRTIIEDRAVRAERSGGLARVEVEGWSVAVVPGFRIRIEAEAESPVEEFRAP
jgi:hypothetical protein